MAITDRNQLQPYSPDGEPAAPDTLARELHARLNGERDDSHLHEFRAHLEGHAQPAGSLAAAEDQFRREMTRANQTPDTDDTWSNA